MMRRASFWPLPVLGALLMVAYVALQVSRPEWEAHPSVDNRGPSGTLVAAELLRQNGFRVRIDRTTNPRWAEDETAIAFCVWKTDAFGDVQNLERPDPLERAHERVQEGSRLIQVFISQDLKLVQEQAKEPYEVDCYDPSGELKTARVAASYAGALAEPTDEEDAKDGLALCSLKIGEAWVEAFQQGQGGLMSIYDGTPFLNEYIDQDDDAELWLRTVAAFTPSRKVVVLETMVGNASQPGVLDTFGPGAKLAWWQLLLTFAMLVYASGKTFGKPVRIRRKQQATRELADALADTTLRGHNYGFVLNTLTEWARRRARSEFEEQKPPTDPTAPEALEWAKRLDSIAGTRPRRGRRPKR